MRWEASQKALVKHQKVVYNGFNIKVDWILILSPILAAS